MFVRYGIRPLLVCSALALCSQIGFAQVKIGVVNLQKAVFDTAEIKKANDEMQAKYKPKQDEISQINAQIEDIAKQLQAGGNKLTPQAQADLQAQGSRLQRDLQYKNQDLQEAVNEDRQNILTNSSQKMIDVIKKIAEEKGLDLVVEAQNSTYYFKPAMDLTADATAAYDKAYPVTAAAPKK
jgi:outer membrane protein